MKSIPSERRSSPVTAFFRRKYLIDTKFQLRYTLTMLVVWTASAAVFGCALAAALIKTASDPTLTSAAVGVFLAGPSLLIFGALFSFGILLTHRISGPVYVMTRIVDELARGELPAPRALRKRDELQGFFRRLGEAIEYLRSKEQREAAVIEQALEQLQSRARPEDAELLNGLTALVETKRRTVGPKTG